MTDTRSDLNQSQLTRGLIWRKLNVAPYKVDRGSNGGLPGVVDFIVFTHLDVPLQVLFIHLDSVERRARPDTVLKHKEQRG